MKRQIVLCVVCLMLSVAATSASAGEKLGQIFQFDMLNAQIAYLESIAGPAMHIYAIRSGLQLREYRVEGCKVYAYAKGAELMAYSLKLSPRCNFNLGDFLGNGYGPTDGMTVGKFVGGSFQSGMRLNSDCIFMCGNAADPVVNFIWEGPHAVNFVNVVLSVTLADAPAIEAAERLEKVIRENGGNDAYLIATKFNCDRRFDAIATRDFANIRVDEISVGFAVPDEATCAR